jgi:L,D-peptidoglycan transpeptidase YkuD (ErfK/YbiS/YcfS/YnhG family)
MQGYKRKRQLGNRPLLARRASMRRTSLATIHVSARPGRRSQGWLRAGLWCVPVALGRAGVKANKREGDGGTPRGGFRPLRLWWRPDRLPRPPTLLPARRIGRADAWSEDPADRRYNRPVRRSANEPGDRLWRDDGLYDLFIEIDHNTRPRIAGRGSAVFVHIARPGLSPTAGCIALKSRDLRVLLGRIGPKTRIIVHN